MRKGNLDWNKYIKKALDRTEFMAISTLSHNSSWVCPVQFSYDEKLDLFFKSMPASKHMQNIKKNAKISAAIFCTNRLPGPGRHTIGIQLKGKAEILHSRKDVTIAAKHHYTRSNPSIDYKARVDKHLGSNAKWNFVKIAPEEVWYFNSKLFDEEKKGRQKVPLNALNLGL